MLIDKDLVLQASCFSVTPAALPALPRARRGRAPTATCEHLKPSLLSVLPSPQGTSKDELVTNAIIASAPGHHLWPYVFDVLKERVGSGDPISQTGAP